MKELILFLVVPSLYFYNEIKVKETNMPKTEQAFSHDKKYQALVVRARLKSVLRGDERDPGIMG